MSDPSGAWANGQAWTDAERHNVALLRGAGCRCQWPLLGYRPSEGPQCWTCGAQATEQVRWVEQQSGCRTKRTAYHSWEKWVDVLFDLGITNPGREGFMTRDDGSTISWGTHPDNGDGVTSL